MPTIRTFAPLFAAAALCAGRVFAAQSGPDAAPTPTPAPDPVALAANADGANAFAAELLRLLVSENDGNIVFAPHSLRTALAVAAYGARGGTRRETLEFLKLAPAYPLRDWDAAHRPLATLDKHLARSGGALRADTRIALARHLDVRKEFIEGVMRLYDADAVFADLDNPAEAAAQLNAWIAERTDGEITQLLVPGALSPGIRLVILNAIRFRGAWAVPFAPERTAPQAFATAQGEVNVPFMSRNLPLKVTPVTNDVLHPETGEYTTLARLVTLPFAEDGWELALFRPEPGAEKDFYDACTAENLCAWFTRHDAPPAGKEYPVHSLALPRFAFSWKPEDMTNVLRNLGLNAAFDADAADFSGITPAEDLSLGAVFHEAKIEIDESGAAAAAATAVSMSKGLTEVFALDVPFVFMLRDARTGAVTLIGRVANPAADSAANANATPDAPGALDAPVAKQGE